MKHIKKLLAIFLTILTMLSVCSVATSVFAAEYVEQNVRNEYFDDALSDYLKNIIDIDNAVAIKEKEDAEKTEEESIKSTPFSIYSAKSASVASVEDSDEIKDETDHTRLTLELKNGTNAAYLFSEPISYTDKNGKLIYKDTNIEEVTDEDLLKNGYTYENGNNDYRIYFSPDSSKGVMLVDNNGNEIKLVPDVYTDSIGCVSAKKQDSVNVDFFEYPGVYGSDTKLDLYPQLNGIKEEIILLRYNGISEFGFTICTGDNIAAINSRGEIEIISPDKKKIIQTFAAPFAYDALNCEDPASEHYTDCTYLLEKVEDGVYSLKIKVPTEYLESENTVYPVTIDPTTSNISMTYDTAVYSAKSTETQSSNPQACFGKTSTSQYGKGRALFYFKIPSDIEKYAKISSAKLWLRETTGRTETMYVRPYLIKDSWNNSVTWSTKPSYYNGNASYPGKDSYDLARRNINSNSSDSTLSSYWYAFDITNAVRSWTTEMTNHGLIFISENEASDAAYLWRGFATKEHTTSAYRPYAVISYTNDTTPPTINSVTGNPTSWTKNDVTLTVNATDNVYGAAGVKEYSFDNGSTWQSNKSKSFSSNQTVKIKAKDYAGNISDTFTVVISKIDKAKPTATIALSPTSFTNGNVTATITLSDNAALESYKIGSDSAVTISGTSKTVTKTYSADATVSVTVTDAAGNSTTVSKNFTNIDKIKPVITGVSGNPTSWTKNDVTLTVTATDEE